MRGTMFEPSHAARLEAARRQAQRAGLLMVVGLPWVFYTSLASVAFGRGGIFCMFMYVGLVGVALERNWIGKVSIALPMLRWAAVLAFIGSVLSVVVNFAVADVSPEAAWHWGPPSPVVVALLAVSCGAYVWGGTVAFRQRIPATML